MTKLSVNINKIATIRNARGGTVPNVVESAKRIQEFGAHGITVHPRPDERHITYQDVKDIAPTIKTEFNIEGYPNRDWLDLVIKTKPTQATLVPDPPGVLTSNAGWDTIEHADFLKEVLNELSSNGIRTSIFIGCEKELIEKAKEVGSDRIELYTEPFADRFGSDKHESVKAFSSASKTAHDVGLGVNAGHDLNLENLRFFKDSLPHLDEVSIGHALISDALYFGLENTVQMYLSKLS
ncbi:MAG: pyridoxine 5'-phosphate synthase [Flavobacteriales bacterium]|jgi:pyridoxine 5-phosphate synthase|nr:pyridoxine 5'-phosphate synthase [Flavobacteriales bacterium]MBT3963296.1 pyridoxine 5'-phosphate synthase [Flavobacteriales bacterium]MBT4706184.1 pyridoxine 5'-phosphate synthase [Flavobacteriales bacterium]MBT4931369.1 pyridoxine 5'-phosphate synthase [Flavobacteriales bacterium]MBT5133197.1 pyridoxine 5'-phosphate synthase [Flavobacteriales bacterium]